MTLNKRDDIGIWNGTH